jgi:hypothetical protein
MATGDRALMLATARERVRLICAQLDVVKGELERALIELRGLQAQMGTPPALAEPE